MQRGDRLATSLSDRDRLATSLGCVTCDNVCLGSYVTRGTGWSRRNEDCDAGVVVGFLDDKGTGFGDLSAKNLAPYRKQKINSRLCAVRWASGVKMISSIGYNGVYELQYISAPSKAMLHHQGSSQMFADCNCSWLSSRSQFFNALKSLGWKQHGTEEWFTNKNGKISWRPATQTTGKGNSPNLVGFADCAKFSLACFRMPGSLFLESKISLARLAGDLMSKTYIIRKDGKADEELLVEMTKCHPIEAQMPSDQSDHCSSRLWFLKSTQANFGKGITLHTCPLDALRQANVKRPERFFAQGGQSQQPWPAEIEAAFAPAPTGEGQTLKHLFERSLNDTEGEFVLQAHIPRPLLYDGRKVHIRLFFLAHNPLLSTRTQYYVARVGWIDVSPNDWTMLSTEKETQQTHTRHSAFQEWDLYPRLFPKCCELMAEMARRVHHKFSEIIVLDRSSFELYGMDVMFDEDFNPWLLEANSGPVLKEPYLPMLRGLLRIAAPWAAAATPSTHISRKLAEQTLLKSSAGTNMQGGEEENEQQPETEKGGEEDETQGRSNDSEFTNIGEEELWVRVADFPVAAKEGTSCLTYKDHLELLYDI